MSQSCDGKRSVQVGMHFGESYVRIRESWVEEMLGSLVRAQWAD